jgi:hypothetical protein
MFLIGDIIELAIQIEQNAEDVYRNALQKISLLKRPITSEN